MRKVMAILWPSFLMAGIAVGVFFSLVNPQELYLFGKVVDYPPLAAYTMGFFAFWALCACSSALTYFLDRNAEQINTLFDGQGFFSGPRD